MTGNSSGPITGRVIRIIWIVMPSSPYAREPDIRLTADIDYSFGLILCTVYTYLELGQMDRDLRCFQPRIRWRREVEGSP